VYWPKPAWQAALPGKGRQTPDISALADPYTGVPIVVTQAGQLDLITGVGGTSLASPIVTAFWAIAQQKAGHALGQAAPTIAALTAGVTDIVPVSFPHGVTAAITDTNGTTDYSTLDLFSGAIPHHQKFVGSLWIFGNPRNAFSLGFGLDTSLTVTDGWDNATGFGTPDGLAFINAAAAYGQN
jgi:subtilase family serine protease